MVTKSFKVLRVKIFKGDQMKFKDTCPICFIEAGYTVLLKEVENGIFQCPRDETHKFKKDENGFWKKVP